MLNPYPGREIPLATYTGLGIANAIDVDPAPGMVALARQAYASLLAVVRQTGRATGRYNCHGLVFASRRTNVPPAGVEGAGLIDRILREDQFRPVAEGDVMPGDLVAWRSARDVDHTGVVCHVHQGLPRTIRVWSMWGGLGEFVHPVHASPYGGCEIEYWRLS